MAENTPFTPTIEDLISMTHGMPSRDMVTQGYAMGADPMPKRPFSGVEEAAMPWWMIPFAALVGAKFKTVRPTVPPNTNRLPFVQHRDAAVAEGDPAGVPYNDPGRAAAMTGNQPAWAPSVADLNSRRQLMQQGPFREMAIVNPNTFIRGLGERGEVPYPIAPANQNRRQTGTFRGAAEQYFPTAADAPEVPMMQRRYFEPTEIGDVIPFRSRAQQETDRMSRPASQSEITTLQNWARSPPRDVDTSRSQVGQLNRLNDAQFQVYLDARSRGMTPQEAMASATTPADTKGTPRGPRDPARSNLIRDMYENRMTAPEIAETLGVSRQTVEGVIRYWGLNRRTMGESAALQEEITRRYRAGETAAAIAESLGMDVRTLRTRLTRAGINRKDE